MAAIADLFTETELKLYEVLKDCKEHPAYELLRALGDKTATPNNLSRHIVAMRSKLMANYDIDIVHKVEGKRISYLLVKRLFVGLGE